ncbi:MAG: hypothetical protein A2V69_01635 [Candidatus Portnoybacteria bacterium RBG_13_40_8]|uniref:HTH HARE-type domain-containing protein n=1 Tax=Candidatus Portnoybacteria bacterium RBG_13_40_8 TaxID=1801990 RepID=A0A1G2F6G5_9BACT|nr:MAG: hypothetical protein A2V69_01635 [Candidatus Portnoybacteria bacterium RBG_13_40_8]OGZ34574.1 MAG: hypothetical protein A2V60_02040 [Candidatus Portnoybacteria bacterium RIFCSPHIGHO2_01_FULL_39_19]
MAKSTSTKNINKTLSTRTEKALLFLTNPRVRDVIERRFGIKNGKIETLEAIGHGYGITRERVRQIEENGLRALKSERVLPLFEPVFAYLNDFFNEHGNLAGEEYLYCTLTNTNEFHPLRGQLYLVLTIGDPYQRIINDERFNPYWITDKSVRNVAGKVVDFLIDHFTKQNKVFHESDILDVLSQKHSNLSQKMLCVILDISKEINKNIFGQLGLTYWPEISPQGVKDRAYLILKKEGKPLHFTLITELINKSDFGDRLAHTQTVHNELIKSPKFVLTGRGTYALAEWGYEPGTVEETIEKILKTNKRPMTKEEILEAVLLQRQVKPTTILLNLQRSPKTKKLGDGKYALV